MEHHWEGSIHIAAPLTRVYRYLADLPRHCEWAQTLERMEQVRLGDSRGIGATYRTDERQAFHSDRRPRESLTNRKAFKGTTVCEVRELVPDRRIAWHAYAVPRIGVHADLAFDLTPRTDGGTMLTQRITMHQPALPLWVFRKLVFKMSAEEMTAKAEAQWRASLRNIKAILEEERQEAAPVSVSA